MRTKFLTSTEYDPGIVPFFFDSSLIKSLVIKSKENKLDDHSKHEMKQKPNILIVEDDPVNQKIVSIWLNKHDYSCDIASNGREGLEKYLRNHYDLIFMDCQMPEIDGYETTRAIRRFEETSHDRAKIIAITANALAGDREKCLACGMDDYITKPINFKLLIEKCNALYD